MRIDHINITAPKALLEEVKDFYCAVLGLSVGPRPDFPFPGYWLYKGENALVHLVEAKPDFVSSGPFYLNHVAYTVDALEPYVENLKRLGIEHTITHVPGHDITQVFCDDPCGNGVEASIRG